MTRPQSSGKSQCASRPATLPQNSLLALLGAAGVCSGDLSEMTIWDSKRSGKTAAGHEVRSGKTPASAEEFKGLTNGEVVKRRLGSTRKRPIIRRECEAMRAT